MAEHDEYVIEIEAGIGDPPFVTIARGVPSNPMSVGRRGDWRIDADGVLDVHAYVYFDGEYLLVHSANEELPALVNGRAVGHEWASAEMPCTIEMGHARLRARPQYTSLREAAEQDQETLARPRAEDDGYADLDTVAAPRKALGLAPPEPARDARTDAPFPAAPPSRPFAPGAFVPTGARDDATPFHPVEVPPASSRTLGAHLGAPELGTSNEPTLLAPPRAAPRASPPPLAMPGAPMPHPPPIPIPAPIPMQPPIPLAAPMPMHAPMPGAPTAPLSPLATGPRAAPPVAKDPSKMTLKEQWDALSWPKKVAMVVLPILLVYFVFFADDGSAPARTKAPVKLADAGLAVRAPTAQSAAPATTAPQLAPPSATSTTPGTVSGSATPATATVGGSAGGAQRSLERQAVDLVASGQYERAAFVYDQLARAYPDRPAFREAARILRAKLDAGAALP